MRHLKNLLSQIFNSLFRQDPLEELLAMGLVVGKNFSMQSGVAIDMHHCWHITIGDDVTLAPGVHITAHDASTKKHLNYTRIGKVTIGDRVFIGAASVILPGVTIGDDVIIGVGSVVANDIPGGSVAVGVPARVVQTMDEFLAKRKAEIESCPVFGVEYTTLGGVTDDKKAEMNDKIKDGFGYVD